MDKREAVDELWYVGLDVSARELVVALGDGVEPMQLNRYGKTWEGHEQLLCDLRAWRAPVRVCLEASGTLQFGCGAGAEQSAGEIQVSLVNPRRARRFAESLGQRSKTDPVDARVLCQYAERMPFASWQPSEEALRLRAITWTIDAYKHTAEKSAARLICQCRTASAARF